MREVRGDGELRVAGLERRLEEEGFLAMGLCLDLGSLYGELIQAGLKS